MPLPPSRRLTLLTGACLAALLTGCGSPRAGQPDASAPGRVAVVASTNVYGDIARHIGGDRVDVTSIINDPGQDPHSYEADPQNQLALSRAKVVIENGGGYDDFVGRMLRAGHNDSAHLVDAVAVSGRTAPRGGRLNEHVWYDFPTVARVADRIAAALAAADPGHARAFARNATDFRAGLAPLEAGEARIRKEHGGEGIAITEPVPLYLTGASGLVDRTPPAFSEAVEEGDDVAPRVLRESLALFTERKVRALVCNEQTSGPQTAEAEVAARAAGIPVVPVTETLPKGEDYLGWMTANVRALAGALAR
ncbi:metal ABC transporter solute-binding protein, Zn/Mn family [Streptomyces sp. NPDC085931]|uniref:metal ABC transporter solute-binding protein, Zn/Mn family n=1 Tax=Streptomyces sp. NPDC085931 TaxID=3365740 RepID=UPI0037CF5B15